MLIARQITPYPSLTSRRSWKRPFNSSKTRKIAHSIAQAVDTDAATLENVTLEEQQAHRDRNIALSLQDVDREDLGLADIVDNSVVDDTVSFVTWDDLKLNHTDRSASSADVESICESITSSFAGPSVPYALRQRQVLE